ncbi:PREDICTED: protein lethal(2)essential for life-like [Ceratosolen solmsi marchali]|uniref:Protein lethal(2)essential for life-like n=1 Tax=Ceratosolen solmsi marchali TaxID=326594 RepID=A0AAJ6YM18_9HYME|nr:PREDICTED: protein lethal(2)essential for life-like [Ceratosolen solmsi marchali]
MRSRMSIIPRLVAQMWDQMERSHRLVDQHFGVPINPEHLFTPSLLDNRRFVPQYRPWIDMMRDDDPGYSMIKKDKFHVALDVQQFKPDEINVKVIDNYVVVEGKHEEKQDDHGIVSRHFLRKYKIPDQCDPEKATSTLSYDGILTVVAPKKFEAIEKKNERILKVERTGKPMSEKEKGEEAAMDNERAAERQ